VLSLVHVLEWRAAVQPDAIALSDDRGAELTYADLAALPRNATGKVQRAALREPFWAGRDRRVS
jgi:hypothetical protein